MYPVIDSSCAIYLHARAQLFKERIQQLKVKERMLLEDNGQLCEKCGARGKPWQ
ncbi:hypothetical protein SLEP1_g3572 [Rubroshorea leprosula]|uniref:Uncharacterized protein n=1 Tax=Rubroshorea leprosula TaxID=152421 RepID=A0AAV5HRX7_9ROSI|nr:hypothetical protein SLEP1_g3572 [Rubroshorea leprosula]